MLRPLRELPDWLVAVTDTTRVAEALTASAPGLWDRQFRVAAVDTGPVRLSRERWTVQYEVTLTDDARDGKVLRLLGTLVPPGRPAPAPGENGTHWLPQLRVLVAVEPADNDLPALDVLTDPKQARTLLETAIVQQSPRYGEMRIATCEPRVMRYSRGSRCTVLYRLAFGAGRSPHWPDVVVAKAYSGNKGEVAWRGMRAVWDTPMATGEPVYVAEPLAFLPDLRVLIQGAVPEEQTLKELIVEAMGTASTAGSDNTAARSRLDTAIARAADGLAALHGCDASADVTVTWDDERADVRQTLERLGETVPSLGPSVEPLLLELAARAGATAADVMGPAHGSFRPAQVLLSGTDASIIDFDGFCLAEPALDIALFRCTLRDIALGELADGPGAPPDERALEQRADEADVLCDSFLERYESHRPVSHARVALYEALDLVTVVLRSWTKVKPARLRHGLVLLERHLERLALG